MEIISKKISQMEMDKTIGLLKGQSHEKVGKVRP
jgi:hypothetical protein